jgi:hypothetical protein
MSISNQCPACGLPLDYQPWDGSEPSEKVCKCCGIQFGYDDADPESRDSTYASWRREWVDGGMAWWRSEETPAEWDGRAQLANLRGAAQAE